MISYKELGGIIFEVGKLNFAKSSLANGLQEDILIHLFSSLQKYQKIIAYIWCSLKGIISLSIVFI